MKAKIAVAIMILATVAMFVLALGGTDWEWLRLF